MSYVGGDLRGEDQEGLGGPSRCRSDAAGRSAQDVRKWVSRSRSHGHGQAQERSAGSVYAYFIHCSLP